MIKPNMSPQPLDRDGNALKPGDEVKVQICSGRYGQTQVLRGTLVEMRHDGVVITLGHDYRADRGKFGTVTLKAGTNFTAYCSVVAGRYLYKHNDYEHGHTRFVEKITPETINQNTHEQRRYEQRR